MMLQILCMTAPTATLFFAGTFTGVIIVNDRVHGRFVALSTFRLLMATICRIRLARLEPPLGHVDPVSMELAGIVYTGSSPK